MNSFKTRTINHQRRQKIELNLKRTTMKTWHLMTVLEMGFMIFKISETKGLLKCNYVSSSLSSLFKQISLKVFDLTTHLTLSRLVKHSLILLSPFI